VVLFATAALLLFTCWGCGCHLFGTFYFFMGPSTPHRKAPMRPPLDPKERDRLAAEWLRKAAEFLDPQSQPPPPDDVVDLPKERKRRKRRPAA